MLQHTIPYVVGSDFDSGGFSQDCLFDPFFVNYLCNICRNGIPVFLLARVSQVSGLMLRSKQSLQRLGGSGLGSSVVEVRVSDVPKICG